MIKQNIDFKEVYDLFAIRIILSSNKEKEKSDCWRVFSIITNLYQSNPERMRDWITVPKSNGYESLHTTVYHPDGRWVEVQIRTERMDEIAERGLAAHWKYKGHGTDDNFDKWLNKIRSTIETPYAEELSTLEQINLGHYSKEIYVFTPKGQLKMLPKGATALDFAYEIHTQVGDKCVGAKVNGKSVPIRYELHNGDRVEIITSKNQKPKTDWIDYVITSKAKSKIKLALKEEKVKQAELGKELFQRRLRNWKIPYNDLIVSNLIQYFKLKNAIDLYSLIGNESIEMSEIKKIITQSSKPQESSSPNEQYQVEKLLSTHFEKAEEVLEIDDKILNNVDYKLAKCCSPIFGDDIFAFVTINDGIKIHRIQCPNANDMLTKYGYRVLKAKWRGEDSKTTFLTAIKVAGVDEIGVLAKISDTISKDLHVRMRSINIDSKNNRFEGVIQLFVKDVAYLDMLIHKILKIKGVEIAKRADYISPE